MVALAWLEVSLLAAKEGATRVKENNPIVKTLLIIIILTFESNIGLLVQE
jgi:hypothetical protein